MKIISISSNIAGHACAIGDSIRKHFYNNCKMTDFFDYLEVDLYSVNQLLSIQRNDIKYLSIKDNYYPNKDNKNTVYFNHFQKMISYHDLNINFEISDYDIFIDKYIRRYNRLIESIQNEDIIFFIRFGPELDMDVIDFINKIKIINSNLKFYFIHLDYNESFVNKIENISYLEEYHYINLYEPDKILNEDLYFQTLDYSWDKVKMNINNILK